MKRFPVRARFASAVLAGLLLTGCALFPPAMSPDRVQDSDDAGPVAEPGRPPADEAVVTAVNRFGLALYGELLAEKGAETNLFLSPLSVALALGMTYNGAAGETAAAMADSLQVAAIPLERLNESYATLREALANTDGDVRLHEANSLWHRADLTFYDDFLARNREYFGATVEGLDFDDPSAPERINQWVAEKTAGRIERIVEGPIDPETALFLINAIYFKGTWREPFDPAATRPAPFRLADGNEREVPMMHRSGRFGYHRGDGFAAARLPYGEEGNLAMYLFLPDADLSLDNLLATLEGGAWDEWFPFEEVNGSVALPRFRLEYESSLRTALEALGMGIAFDRVRADFSRMRPVRPTSNLYISDVLHKTYLDVNEEGTEASGATSVEIGITSAPAETVSFVADRPFFFVIRDDRTGAILFTGSVADPVAAR